jgi:hypothetical protein
MVVRQREEVESEAQFQNPAPIGPQSQLPTGVHDMIVSWDRTEGYMSVRTMGDRWWFKEFLGTALLTGTDSAVGRLHIRAKGQLNGEQLVLWRPSDAEPHTMVTGTRREVSYNRLCYFRAEQMWRLRDEKMDWNHLDALRVIKGYVGDWNIEWPVQDTIAHLFHKGFVVICDAKCFMHQGGGYGHFYNEERWEEFDA